MRKTKYLVQGAILGALYVALGYLQELLLPGSGHLLVQCRVAEALCIFALFTPAAVYGLGVGCFLLNLAYAPAMPMDLLFGTAATVLGCWCMYLLRKKPMVALWMPVVSNGLLLALQWRMMTGGGFWMTAAYMGAGEALAIFVPGLLLRRLLTKNRMVQKLLGDSV